ncbi:MAG: hypothetical protein JJE51_01445 [Thermoanaerobaculia bacterium]|nr:hypothetical protein [Thermoanaerobaculia bacterium]
MQRLAQLLVLAGFFSAGAFAQDIALRKFETEGFAALNSKEYPRCAAIFSAAATIYADEPSPAFAAARCHLRVGNTNLAKRWLRRALDRGYRNCANLAREAALASVDHASERCAANAEKFVRESNPELLAAYLGDREDRRGEIADVDAVQRRDHARQAVVRIAIERKTLRTADDYLHAALVMHHGSSTAAFALARDLAKKAVSLRPWLAEARWLHATATDRYLQSIGKPQIFGTQYKEVNGRWTLEPFDPTAVGDAERALWRVHSLGERLKFIDDLNRAQE